MRTNRQLVEETLSPARTHLLWSTLFEPALPMTPQDFELSGVLPAIMYMARYGQRRGAGKFAHTFSGSVGKLRVTTISSVAGVLAQQHANLLGFDDEVGQAILGDMLLTWCLENTNLSEGQGVKVARVYPTHFLASWIDLPASVSDLRGVPELITSVLADQPNSEFAGPSGTGRFPIGVPPDVEPPGSNPLLTVLGTAIRSRSSNTALLTADSLDEALAGSLGMGELLMARMALATGQAPMPASGGPRGGNIPNRRPANVQSARGFREDVTAFVRRFGNRVPRQTFTQMLECAFSVGMTQMVLRSAQSLFHLERSGQPVPESVFGTPWPLFVDCSEGRDRQLRHEAEDSLTETYRRFERLPVVMMIFRIIYQYLHDERLYPTLIPHRVPDPTKLLETLAAVYRGEGANSDSLKRDIGRDCRRLAEQLRDPDGDDPDPEHVQIASALDDAQTHPVTRLAEALCELMGFSKQQGQYLKTLDSSLGAARPTGLAARRRTGRAGYVRSVVLHTPMIDYLVHRHLVIDRDDRLRHLSLKDFLDRLRTRHGFWIDQSPPGTTVPSDLLRRNKELFESRLRDLGLLVTVNDAETMKSLRERY